MFEILGTIVVLGIVGFTLYLYAFRKPCYRIKEVHRMYDGEIHIKYEVEQYRKVLLFSWWRLEDDGNEFSDGSVFSSMEDAEKYIASIKYNRKKHEIIHESTCLENDR